MPETWVTDEHLPAAMDGSSFVDIPPGERIEVGYWLGNGMVRNLLGSCEEQRRIRRIDRH
jgi:hypothetical protein